jgi:hypothetical protein
MEDITNGINNVGKPPSDKVFDFRLSWREIILLTGLLQNPHPNYQGSEELMAFCEEGFEKLKFITDYHTGRRTG